MQILLINPPQLSNLSQITDGLVPPIGLMYLSSVLKKSGFNAKIVDALGEQPNNYFYENGTLYRGMKTYDILRHVTSKTKVIGISCMYSINFSYVRRLCHILKKNHPNSLVFIGGAHASALPEYSLRETEADFTVISEGEETFLKTLKVLKENRWRIDKGRLKGIKGIGFRLGPKIYVNKEIELIRDINKIPYPDYTDIPLKNYFSANDGHGVSRKKRWTVMLFSRGCPNECSFCNTPLIWRRRFRVRNPDDVIGEILFLQSKFSIEEIHFEDENMSANPNRLSKFCERLVENKITISWHSPNGIRPEGITPDLLEKMKKAGCTTIVLAPESGSERVLKEIIRKNINLDTVLNVAKMAGKLKILTQIYFIIGLPGETKKYLFKTKKFGMACALNGVDECSYTAFAPLPGSELFNKLLKEKKIQLNDSFFSSLVSMQDLEKVKSWCENISDNDLRFYRLFGYVTFHVTKLIFHPIKLLRSIMNIITGRLEIKTERFIVTKMRKIRYLLKSALFKGQ
jgi:anaerobic magnesium-protoporphyrin IX monomethyl ester cyclase